MTDPEAMKNPAVAEAKKLIAEGFEKKSVDELVKLLEHPHRQVRQEAQFELATAAGAAVSVREVLKGARTAPRGYTPFGDWGSCGPRRRSHF